MTKLTDQFPRANLECTFHLANGENFVGFYDHGGVWDKSKIVSIKGGTHYFEQDAIGDRAYINIVCWEYLKK